ncbi:putative butyrophilin subfamily 2 member A3, partial [Astyanax mexicanus]
LEHNLSFFLAFSLQVPGGFIQAKVGSSVLLPCEMSPALNAESYKVSWYRPNKEDSPVLLYKDLKVQENTGDPQYRGRVSLVGDLQKGNISLKLENLTVADRGEYVCFVQSGTWYERASVNLDITVVGSLPVLSLAETGDEVNVTCASDGWSPIPIITWKDMRGRELRNSVVQHKTDSEGLVSVRSWLMFSPSDSEWISCSVGLSDHEIKEGRVLPLKSAPATEQTSGVSPGWKVSFIISLLINLLVFTVMAFLFIPKIRGLIFPQEQKITSKGEIQDKNMNQVNVDRDITLPPETVPVVNQTAETTAEAAQTSEKTDKATNTEKEITDWEKMLSCKVAIRPMKSSRLVDVVKVEVDKSNVTRITCKSDIKATDRARVLCEERISSGRYYWEITALTEPPSSLCGSYEYPSPWYVGVTTETAWNKQHAHLSSENDFWILQYEKEKGYYVNDPVMIPVLVRDRFYRLGVYIDCERHTLSFYDCDKRSHLYTFYNIDSTKPLIPVLSPGNNPKYSIAICEDKCFRCDELYLQQDTK